MGRSATNRQGISDCVKTGHPACNNAQSGCSQSGIPFIDLWVGVPSLVCHSSTSEWVFPVWYAIHRPLSGCSQSGRCSQSGMPFIDLWVGVPSLVCHSSTSEWVFPVWYAIHRPLSGCSQSGMPFDLWARLTTYDKLEIAFSSFLRTYQMFGHNISSASVLFSLTKIVTWTLKNVFKNFALVQVLINHLWPSKFW